MRLFRHRLLCVLLSFVAAAPSVFAQDDSTVKLIRATSAQLVNEGGKNYRKVIGPARFFHNNTYLLCDTAFWDVNTNIIDAIGHVKIIQDRTQLTSNTLQYVVDENMAKFRGSLVQLEDKDKNTLRTRYLDYNTKDSVAVFQDGAAMRDKDGQIIESRYGTYDSKAHLFVFNDRVNMYMDTTFVKTSRLEYRTDLSTAYFGYGTDMWQDDNMLSANDGWYDRGRELFFFRRNVHILTEDQEAWSDSLFYHRVPNDVEMLGKVELMDTTRNVFALAGRFEYVDSLSQVTMTREPAVMSISEEKGRRDTTYVGGEKLCYRTVRMCDIPESVVSDARKRLKDMEGDPVMEYRRKAAEAAAKAAEEASKNDPNRPQGGKASGDQPGLPTDRSADQAKPPADTLSTGFPADSLSISSPVDSLSVTSPVDSLATFPVSAVDSASVAVEEPKDTSKVAFLWGIKRVRLFRNDMQMACDSLAYNDLDSLVRLYRDPIFFNEGNRQYASDSIYVVTEGQRVKRANLMSNAFITIQEDPVSFDQIRGAEMVAYFDSTAVLTRFDALGGAASIFYLTENDVLATVNKVESKMIYATFADGQLDKIYYFEDPKNDGYPTVQLPGEEKTLKGFRWEPEKRPDSPADVTSLVPRSSQRTSYLARPHADFKETETYFPGHIKKVYRDIAIRDSLSVVRARERERARAMEEAAAGADVSGEVDAVTGEEAAAFGEEVAASGEEVAASGEDGSVVQPVKDTLSTVSIVTDSLSVSGGKPVAAEISEKERKMQEKQKAAEEKARQKAEKQARREAKWAEEDRRYEERQAAKAQKKLDKERAKKLKALRKLEKKAQKERRQFEKYLERAERRAARRAARRR